MSARAAIDARDYRAIEVIARCDPDALTGLHAKMLDAGLLRPAIAYRTADAATRDRLIETLHGYDGSSPSRGSADTLMLDALLTALAWIGDSAARDAFRAFREERPTWADALYLAPDAYTITAGWVLRPNGSRRDLFLAEGRALVRSTEPSGPVRVLGLTDDRCRFCENPLGTLFEMDLRAPELAFLTLGDEAFPIPFCHLCSCYGTIAFRIDANGRGEWHESNERFPVYDNTFSQWKEPLALGRPLTNPFEYAGWVDDDLGHVGGYPGWIQDNTYPNCPDCTERMTFLGQVDVSSGGRFYGLGCLDCRTVATVYQQT